MTTPKTPEPRKPVEFYCHPLDFKKLDDFPYARVTLHKTRQQPEVVLFREVLTPETPSEYERGVRAAVEVLREMWATREHQKISNLYADAIEKHFNLTPKDKRSDGK